MDDVLNKKLVNEKFKGWIVIPSCVLGVPIHKEFARDYEKILGEPVKQFEIQV